jgi:hypothetical protein
MKLTMIGQRWLAWRPAACRTCALMVVVGLSGCRTATPTTPRVVAAQPSASPTTAAPAVAVAAASPRERWLEMFARGYFPGRSGQIFVVPREGEVITEHDPLYVFMHGSPWDYDTHIPLLFYGTPFVRAGAADVPVVQQDIVPTLAAIMRTAPPATVTGRVLDSVLAQTQTPPRVVAVIVLDAMRADYFDTYAEVMPTLSRMRREGAWFSNARVNVLPTVTGVGHATIGTGTDPRIHGITVNNLFNRITRRSQQAYDALDPRELMALTLADTWNLATDGGAIIIGQGGAIRATAGLVGRGACLINGRKVLAASYSTADAGWETNPTCYSMPAALAPLNGRKVWEDAGGHWMGHDIASPSRFRASSLFQRFEGDALVAVMDHEAIGADEVTDLVMVNMKGPDYVAHAYGPASPELKETLAELDRQMARVLETLNRKAGTGRAMVVVTADHGMPPEPAPGHRHYADQIAAAIHRRFDPDGTAVVQYYMDAANSQIYIDTVRLRTLGFSLDDVGTMLAEQEYFAAAFTEDEVRAAQSRLGVAGSAARR